MLKKEFKRKDVQRVRNLVRGKTDDATGIQIGYKKELKEHKEGDVWTEGRKTWTIKNGIKQTVSKLDAIKKAISMPLCCPKCGKVMKSQLDKPNYRIHKKCHSCVVYYESRLKLRGQYDDYKKTLEKNNSLTIIDEMESYLLDAINSSNSGFVSEDGVVERWVGGVDKEKMTKQVKEAIKIRKKHINKQ
tara:strand:- start:92 stop:658 length:567 start_codon:yes stop_codon:yes gene_type:complete